MTDKFGETRVIRLENGARVPPPFSAAEFERRRGDMRQWMETSGVDACLFTSYHEITYLSGWLYTRFGRPYGLVLDAENAVTVSSLVDGGQPWRRAFTDNLVYTDWRKGNYFLAVREALGTVRRLGIEFDHVTLEFRDQLAEALPGVVFEDVSEAAMQLRLRKSEEEIALIRGMARIADIGGAAAVATIAPGVREHEVALAATDAMVREIARAYPDAELRDTWSWVQSGINTDGAHNPVTSRPIGTGEPLSVNCFPMVYGYYAALERSLFLESASDAQLEMWERNCAVHSRGIELIRPGARCCDIAAELNAMYREWELLQYRTFGYGHSFGVLSHYYGREAALEIREDVETRLEPGAVVSMEPMITIPEGLPGAGGYREHDILVVTEDGAENLTGFPYGPEHNLLPVR